MRVYIIVSGDRNGEKYIWVRVSLIVEKEMNIGKEPG